MRTGLPPRRLLAGGLVVVGLAAIVAGLLAGAGAPAEVQGRDRPVNIGAGNLSDISAHNSPTPCNVT